MSGFIRVKELPTRWEVRTKHAVERFSVKEHAVEEHSKREAWEQSAKFVTIRRWQVTRTELTEERDLQRTSWAKTGYANLIASAFAGLSKQTEHQWHIELYAAGERPVPCSFGTREEAEAAARKWLEANGYRLRKAPTKQGEG
jgi:hypothetical protein